MLRIAQCPPTHILFWFPPFSSPLSTHPNLTTHVHHPHPVHPAQPFPFQCHACHSLTTTTTMLSTHLLHQIKHTLQHFNVFPFALGSANGGPDVIVRQHDLVV
jgi:hypothetical protein